MARTFYRIVGNNPPTIVDVTSKLALGRLPSGADVETVRLESGISTYATEAQARRKARALRFLGNHIAALRIEDDAPIRYERTTRSGGHHTLWGEPTDLLARVVSVVRV